MQKFQIINPHSEISLSIVKRNLIANFAGKTWVGFLNLALIPLYIKYMGIEAYGLVGFLATLQSALMVFDMGLSIAMNRELARYSVMSDHRNKMRDLVRTLEIIYWSIAGLIGLTVCVLSPFITTQWVNSQALSPIVVQRVIMLMGLSLVFQLPVVLYTGGLMGLQQQAIYNILNALVWTIRGFGALVVIRVFEQPVMYFFYWQVIASLLNVIIIAAALWRYLPLSNEKPRFQKGILQTVWKFAAGMGIYSVTVMLFNQVDKIIVSRQVSLAMFGYYSLSWQIAGILFLLYAPIYTAFFPLFSQLAAKSDFNSLKKAYHRGCQTMSVAILPVVIVIALFAPEILLIWTGNPTIVRNTHILVTLLICGAAFGALLYLPFSIAQAYAHTKTALYTYFIALIILTPLTILSVDHYGAIGAAVLWVTVNAVQSLVIIHFTHKRFMPGEQLRWYVDDVARPFLATLTVAGIARFAFPEIAPAPVMICYLIGTWALAFIVAALATPATYNLLRRYIFPCKAVG